jgi:DNA-binding MarR family transcriptional regulator
MRGGTEGADVVRNIELVAWLRLAHVFAKMERASIDHLRGRGLSLAQFDVLAQVGAHDGSTQQEVADALLVTKGNVTQLLDKMELAGLLRRRQEGRVNRLCLTEAGRKLYDRVVPEQEARIAEQFEALSPSEREQLHRLLRKLDRGLETHGASGGAQGCEPPQSCTA